MINKILFIIISSISMVYSSYPYKYNIDSVSSVFEYRNRELINDLKSKSVVDFRLLNNQSIVIGTSGGLGLIEDDMSFYSFGDSNLPYGGNPALEVYKDENLIIVSGVETINFLNEEVASGTGISWSLDNGNTWNYISQPQDELPDCENLTCENPLNSPDECECSPAASGCSWNVPNQTCSLIGSNIIFEWGGQNLSSLAIQTSAKNVTYDVSADVINEYIYAANWAGMLRRFKYTDDNPTWELVPLPMDNQSSVNCGSYPVNYLYNPVDPLISGYLNYGGNHNHKVFSVYIEYYNEEIHIWVGTADGINRGIIDDDGCIDWVHYTTENNLAGDWIIDIVPQNIGNEVPRVWLVSWDRDKEVPYPNGITYTDDNGNTWNQVIQFDEEYVDVNNNEIYDQEDNIIEDLNANNIYDGATLYNLYFIDDLLYASTNRGLYYTYTDNILNWSKIDFPQEILELLDYNEIIEESIFYKEKVYSCIKRNDKFFIGTPKGLIWVEAGNNINSPHLWQENSWNSYIASNQNIVNSNKLHIWPNPFFIEPTYTNVDFQYKTILNSGKIEIYDFSMNLVNSFPCDKKNDYENLECSWDGRNSNRIKVSNGVYFCKLIIGNNEVWEKLMIFNAAKGHY